MSTTTSSDVGSELTGASGSSRLHPFLTAFTGTSVTHHTVNSFTRSQVAIVEKGVVAVDQILMRTVVAIEGDPCFRRLKAASGKGHKRGRGGQLIEDTSNCVMASLHHQLPNGNHITLRIVLASALIRKREMLALCPLSVERAVDETAWYRRQYGPSSLVDGLHPIAHWPSDVPYYHGLGDATKAATHPPTVGFPASLLRLQPSSTLPGELEVVAAALIPAGTCFNYTGELRDGDSSTPSDSIYSFQLRDHQTVEGSGITRYINHRFRYDPYGNVQFAQASLPNSTDAKRIHDGDSRMIGIPFFVTTRDVVAGEQLLATSYGDVYDAQLERDIFVSPELHVVPCGTNAVRDHAGAYRWAMGVGDVVHVPSVSVADVALLGANPPTHALFLVEAVNDAATMVLMRPMKSASGPTTIHGGWLFEPNTHAPLVVCHMSHLVPLAPHVDVQLTPTKGPIQSAALLTKSVAPLHPPTRATNALLSGSYWFAICR